MFYPMLISTWKRTHQFVTDALATRSAGSGDTLASVLEDLHGWPQDAAAEAVALVTSNLQVRGRWQRVAASLTYPDRAAMVAARPQVQRLLLLGLNAEQLNSLDLPRKSRGVPDTAERARTRALKNAVIHCLNDTWATLLRLRFPQEDASPPDLTSQYPPLMYAEGSATGALQGMAVGGAGGGLALQWMAEQHGFVPFGGERYGAHCKLRGRSFGFQTQVAINGDCSVGEGELGAESPLQFPLGVGSGGLYSEGHQPHLFGVGAGAGAGVGATVFVQQCAAPSAFASGAPLFPPHARGLGCKMLRPLLEDHSATPAQHAAKRQHADTTQGVEEFPRSQLKRRAANNEFARKEVHEHQQQHAQQQHTQQQQDAVPLVRGQQRGQQPPPAPLPYPCAAVVAMNVALGVSQRAEQPMPMRSPLPQEAPTPTCSTFRARIQQTPGTMHDVIETAQLVPIVPYEALAFDRSQCGDRVELGRGALSSVFAATFRCERVAVKVFVLPPSAAARAAVERRFWLEARVQYHVRHDGVVPLMAAVVKRNEPEGPPTELALIMPRYERSLGEVLMALSPPAPPQPLSPLAVRVGWLRSIASALRFLHASGIIHGNLKPANVLLDGENRVRLADFGRARVRKTEVGGGGGSTSGNSLSLGSARDSAVASSASAPCEASDVFSFGILAWQVLAGRVPCDGLRVDADVGGGGVLPPLDALPCDTPADLVRLLAECWAPTLADRPKALAVCERLESAAARLR